MLIVCIDSARYYYYDTQSTRAAQIVLVESPELTMQTTLAEFAATALMAVAPAEKKAAASQPYWRRFEKKRWPR